MRFFPTFWRRRFATWLSGFTPPAFDNILQWLDGTQTALGFYNGIEENGTETTITRNQSITADWSVWLEAIWIPQDIGEYEGVHEWDNGLIIEWDSKYGGEVQLAGNGIPYTYTDLRLNYNETNILKVELRTGEFRITVNNMSLVITGITFNSLESASSVFTGRGYILSLSDGEQTYYPDQTYPEVVTTDPNGTYRKYNQLNDKSENGNYGLYDNETGLINIDPNGTLETALGLTAGTLNGFYTREYLATVYDRLKIWTPFNDGLKYLSVIYNAIVADASDKNKLDKYVRRTAITAIDVNGDTAIDSNGDIGIGA